MRKKLTSLIKPLLKSLFALGLVLSLAFGHAGDALAAGGGRIGGGSFRAPSRTYSAPRTYAPPGGGYGYGYGGGYGLPFFFPSPIFWVGGSGLFSILIFLAIAGFLVQTFRRSAGESLEYGETVNPTVSVTRLQVGLLAEARELQADLNKLAMKADTASTAGLAEVLQETSLALLRHPEYWVYGSATTQQARLQAAEAEFNRLALAERSKFSRETLSNVNNQLRQAEVSKPLPGNVPGGALVDQDPAEYIVVTLLVGTQGGLQLPAVNSQEDMRKALQQLGGVSGDRLLALEVLWTPQAENEVLSSEDMLVQYPNFKLL